MGGFLKNNVFRKLFSAICPLGLLLPIEDTMKKGGQVCL